MKKRSPDAVQADTFTPKHGEKGTTGKPRIGIEGKLGVEIEADPQSSRPRP